MLAVILKILSILGIILLILLCILVVVLLLVLFMPIVYQINAVKNEETISAKAKIRWLFGLLRVGYSYPEPGKLVVKVLWFTVYDSGTAAVKNETPVDSHKDKSSEETIVKSEPENTTLSTQENADNIESSNNENDTNENLSNDTPTESESIDDKKSLSEKLFAKYEKIKYTIRQICDKIKHILENITFYKNLLQDEDTKLLFSHACKRLGKILHNIRPRKLKANVIFGASSPDTTGYAYGVYGMFSPKLGKDVCITPDFTQQILIGTVYAAGHITIFTLLVNLLAVLFDKRLRILKARLDAHKKQTKK